jgi:hypothetical protein
MMYNRTMDYLRNLVLDIPVLNEKLTRCIKYWGDETPPPIVAFGDIGDAIVDNLTALSGEVRQKVFASIESGMTDPDDDIRTAMATGLIEALISRSDGKPGLWAEIESLLGPDSKKYALAWRSFGS